MKKWLIICLFVLMALPHFAAAGESEYQFMGIRQKAMGGAGVASVFNEQALHQNPAGLAKAGFHVKLPRMQVAGNDFFMNNKDKITDLFSDKKSKTEKYAIAQGLTPFNASVITAANPAFSWTLPGFGFGLFAETRINIDMLDRAEPRVEATGQGDAAGILGFAREVTLFDQPMYLGASLFYLYRNTFQDANGNNSYRGTLGTVLDGATPNYLVSSGLGLNLGALMPATTWFGPGYYGVSVKNLISSIQQVQMCESKETGSKGQSHLPFVTTVGLSAQSHLPQWVWYNEFFGDFTTAIDYKLIGTESSLFKRLFMGVEKQVFGTLLSVRGGLYQGYPSCGVGLDLYLLHLDYAYLTEELGSELGVKPISYHVIQAAILF